MNWKETIITIILLFCFLWINCEEKIECNNKAEKVIKELEALRVSEDQVYKVDDMSFTRDVATYHLGMGNLYILSQVDDENIAVFYEGEGKVEINFERKYDENRVISEFDGNDYLTFDYLYMIFSDTTYQELSRNLQKVEKRMIGEIKKEVKQCKEYGFDNSLIKDLLNNGNEYFYAVSYKRNHKNSPLIFNIDPYFVEEVWIGSRRTGRNNYLFREGYITGFHKVKDYDKGLSDSEDKEKIDVKLYSINSSITKKMVFSAESRIDFTGLKDSGRWLSLSIEPEIEIDSVFIDQVSKLNFYETDYRLWFELPDSLKFGENYSITIKYGGDLIHSGGSIVNLKDANSWYPRYPSRKGSNYDLIFNFPSRYDVVSVGEKVAESEKDKVKTSHWKTKHPVKIAPFNMGLFECDEVDDPRLPKLSFYINDNMKKVKADVANSMFFFQTNFGKCGFDSITIAELPGNYSVLSYPRLINVATDDWFRADEHFSRYTANAVADQWWGQNIEHKSYHDIWLTTGLSEFCGIWYIQRSKQDNDKYFEYLETMKEVMLKVHDSRSDGDFPLWSGSLAPAIVYNYKGAWVIHMLRNLMMDIESFDETRFTDFLKDFYQTYKGKHVSTEDFKLVLEKHMKMDMTWFFDPWVYGNELPKFDYDYEIKKEGEKFIITFDIKQENVSNTFKSYIPIELDFGQNRKYRFRTLIEGNEKVFDFTVPVKPKDIEFNVFSSVLSTD